MQDRKNLKETKQIVNQINKKLDGIRAELDEIITAAEAKETVNEEAKVLPTVPQPPKIDDAAVGCQDGLTESQETTRALAQVKMVLAELPCADGLEIMAEKARDLVAIWDDVKEVTETVLEGSDWYIELVGDLASVFQIARRTSKGLPLLTYDDIDKAKLLAEALQEAKQAKENVPATE